MRYFNHPHTAITSYLTPATLAEGWNTISHCCGSRQDLTSTLPAGIDMALSAEPLEDEYRVPVVLPPIKWHSDRPDTPSTRYVRTTRNIKIDDAYLVIRTAHIVDNLQPHINLHLDFAQPGDDDVSRYADWNRPMDFPRVKRNNIVHCYWSTIEQGFAFAFNDPVSMRRDTDPVKIMQTKNDVRADIQEYLKGKYHIWIFKAGYTGDQFTGFKQHLLSQSPWAIVHETELFANRNMHTTQDTLKCIVLKDAE